MNPNGSVRTGSTKKVNMSMDGKHAGSHPSSSIAQAKPSQNSTSRLPQAQTYSKASQSPNIPFPSPLPLLSLAAGSIPPHLRRLSLSRRRSSFPPAGTPASSSSNLFPWVVGGTPGAGGHEYGSGLDNFPGFGHEVPTGSASAMDSWNALGGWESLLSFDNDGSLPKPNVNFNHQPSKTEMERTKSDPSSNHFPARLPYMSPDNSMNGSEAFKATSDLAWRTILSSMVEVETVGQVVVVQILQEIWNRGGGDVVTSRCLWPEIITALSPYNSRPSAQASLALQTLYNLTIRQWEPTVFSGLLSSYTASLPSNPIPHESTPQNPITASTGDDFAQWMNVTPGVEWSSLANFFGSTGHTPKAGTPNRRSSALRGTVPSFTPDYFDENQDGAGNGGGGVRGLDDLIAMMEDEKHERALEAANMVHSHLNSPSPQQQQPQQQPSTISERKPDSQFQLPTPPTDSASSPSSSNSTSSITLLNLGQSSSSSSQSTRKSVDASTTGAIGYSPISMASPYVSANASTPSFALSNISQSLDTRSISLPPVSENESTEGSTLVDPASKSSDANTFNVLSGRNGTNGNSTGSPTASGNSLITANRSSHPMKVEMPTIPFVPPPPMCMFFSPAFKDLQQGKVGLWKGDLEVRGRGGGKFSILIVGEQSSEHVWQKNMWPSTISYPPEPAPLTSNCTSSMIPVANLAREGYMPVAMGMVLCNDENISAYVAMVQGLHAEGVAFHLPGLTRLPIVFLPAKFDSSDTLQRLGVAFMSKDRQLPPAPVKPLAGVQNNQRNTEEPLTKRRKSRRASDVSQTSAGGPGYRKRASVGSRKMKIDEEIEA